MEFGISMPPDFDSFYVPCFYRLQYMDLLARKACNSFN